VSEHAQPLLLDEQDYQEIDELLADFGADEGLRLDGAHGLLTAVIVGPRSLGPEEWLPVILGGEPVGADAQRLQRLLDLLVRLAGSIVQSLDTHQFEPIFAERETEEGDHFVDASGWCEGFSLGVDLEGELWEERMQEDPALIELIAPVVTLGVDDGVFAEVRDPEMAALGEDERDELIRQLPGVLTDIRQYWQDQPPEDGAPVGATLH
jgi:uncharacterized protein